VKRFTVWLTPIQRSTCQGINSQSRKDNIF
jgi:hypothetical protein